MEETEIVYKQKQAKQHESIKVHFKAKQKAILNYQQFELLIEWLPFICKYEWWLSSTPRLHVHVPGEDGGTCCCWRSTWK